MPLGKKRCEHSSSRERVPTLQGSGLHFRPRGVSGGAAFPGEGSRFDCHLGSFQPENKRRSRNAASPHPSLPRPTALKQRLPRRRPCLRKVTLNQWLCPPGDPRQRQEQLWPPRLCRGVPLAPGGQRPGCCSSSCDARDGPAAENGRPGNVGGAEAEEACPPPTYRGTCGLPGCVSHEAPTDLWVPFPAPRPCRCIKTMRSAGSGKV